MQTIEPTINFKDESLNREIEHFNSNGSALQDSRFHSPQKLSYDAQEYKLENLRSALDKPLVYGSRLKQK